MAAIARRLRCVLRINLHRDSSLFAADYLFVLR